MLMTEDKLMKKMIKKLFKIKWRFETKEEALEGIEFLTKNHDCEIMVLDEKQINRRFYIKNGFCNIETEEDEQKLKDANLSISYCGDTMIVDAIDSEYDVAFYANFLEHIKLDRLWRKEHGE